MNKREAITQGLCPTCKDYDPGYIECNAARGHRCAYCEFLEREGLAIYGEGLPFDHICDDCAGLGTYEGYKIYCGHNNTEAKEK